MKNILNIETRLEFRKWLENYADKEDECYLINLKRGKPIEGVFSYLDAVEEALCFGWIDSTLKRVDGVQMQRFSKRKPNSPWTELNKERVRRLEKLGLMQDSGRRVLPDMDGNNFVFDKEIVDILKKENLYEIFISFPALYQRIRIYNLVQARKRSAIEYQKALDHFLKETRLNKMYGNYDDYGRLTNY